MKRSGELLTVGSVARRLNLLPSTIFMLSPKGCLSKPQKIGDRFFFVKKELERCLGEGGRRVHREKKFRHPWGRLKSFFP